ncbi:MAG: hypothetical protein LN413_00055 [Candidatus Thermoplasmatota archaeon]|nr:hypothetical protein [Candidatus Thermoplasmatota archaeon]
MGRNRFLGSVAYGSVSIQLFASLADADTITILNKTYEVEVSGGVTAGNVSVAKGADAPGFISNLVTAINANKPTVPVTAYIDPQGTSVCRIEADDKGAAGNIAFTASLTGATNVISGSGTLIDGENSGTQTLHRGTHTVDQLDLDAGSVQINTGLQSVSDDHFFVEIYDSASLLQAINTDKITVRSSKYIEVDVDGGVNIALNDVVHWQAWE